nr:hypothetical protein [Tanacetum cinerariifolium]
MSPGDYSADNGDKRQNVMNVNETVTENGNQLDKERVNVMDSTTVEMCKVGVGRVGYARVLVEVNANNSLPNEIEVVYKDKDKVELCRKKVQVRFNWIPPRCSECCVFGHTNKFCEKKGNKEVKSSEMVKEKSNDMDKEQDNYGSYMQRNKVEPQFMYQEKSKSAQGERDKDKQTTSKIPDRRSVKEKNCANTVEKSSGRKSWSIRGELLDVLRKSANKFYVLSKNEGNEAENRYRHDIGSMVYENDVFKDMSGVAQDIESDIIEVIDKGCLENAKMFSIDFKFGCWNIRGLSTFDKQNEIRKFIEDEKLKCVNMIEVDDIACSEMFFTWTKNLYKTKSGDDTRIQKKLDRAISNEAFVLQAKRKPFRFANFVSNKEEFIEIIKKQ